MLRATKTAGAFWSRARPTNLIGPQSWPGQWEGRPVPAHLPQLLGAAARHQLVQRGLGSGLQQAVRAHVC